ncbi:MAG: hypothetical protein M3P51_00530, partial [Chloroflexota bacterium]|nr:hypothetical protein [Chloroflexota bacterium]
MTAYTLVLPAPERFSLAGVATAHGWHALAPYRWDLDARILHRTEDLPSGAVTHLEISQDSVLLVRSETPLSAADQGAVEE